MHPTAAELAILETYAASARHAARLLGRGSRRAADLRLRLELAHRAGCARDHAGLWTDTIRALGARAGTVAAPIHAAYPDDLGHPDDLVHLLALVRVSERRLAREMLRHFHRDDVHPIVRSTLRRMIEEEMQPDWVLPWLQAEAHRDARRVRDALRRYVDADAAVPDLVADPEPLRPAA